MQIAQNIRRMLSSVSRTFRFTPSGEPVVEMVDETTAEKPARKRRSKRFWLIVASIGFVVLLWPGIAFLLVHKINDDTALTANGVDGGAASVSITIFLMQREVNQTGWTPNAPWFMPAALLNNMPNFQIGVVKSLGRFAFELEDQVGRERGSSAADADLEIARARLQYDPTVWLVKPGTLWPTASAEDQYREAITALKRYNARLAKGEATFDARADNLMAVLNRIALDIGGMSAELDAQIDNRHKTFGLLDMKADKIFYRVKGGTYAYFMLLQALQTDFSDVIKERNTARLYDEMLLELRRAAVMQPLVVNNGTPSGQAFPNHLANQGFHLLRARTKMREITDVLQK
ncbi:hypothetical protein MNBD_ALPHA06-288 [hydrothermal vent metagenome]|uniref:DUF2333 family protein n=1 Tax=hydrothermal vent metagenome TaxID=652676 RepID=A0A3B0S343_9ZZZZ